jgi:myo-inositol-1(or 4)-monophosphatase
MEKIGKEEIKAMLDLADNAAQAGGEILRHFWGNLKSIEDKAFAGDLVTEADRASERAIVDLITAKYPSHAILGEESGAHRIDSSPYLWIIDPLDGTTNYSHQYPMVAVSIALLHEGIPIVAVVFNPLLGEKFVAVKGQGATLNGRPIHVSSNSSLEKCLLASGFAYDRRQTKDNNYAEFCRLTDLTQGVRRGGSAALDLAYVAAGRFDGYWERGIQPWDIAAGVLLVTEAGGSISGYVGEPLDLFAGRVVATNGNIHAQLLNELAFVRN